MVTVCTFIVNETLFCACRLYSCYLYEIMRSSLFIHYGAYLLRQIGQTLPVLFETETAEGWQGHSDNYCLVRTEEAKERGTVQNIQIFGVDGEKLLGK